MRIVFTGGGTGGHLIPFEPLIEAIRTYYLEQKNTLPAASDPNTCELYFLGIVDETTKAFFSRYDVRCHNISSGKLRRYASIKTVGDLLWRLPWGIVQALIKMWRIMPDVVVSKGGYGSLPILVAAVIYRIPILLHESDAVSGLSNRLAARWAATITVGFAVTREEMTKYKHKTFVTGTPVRSSFGRENQAEAKQSFGFAATELVVLVMGGSQGAQQINEIVLQVLPEFILEAGIIHITGVQHYTNISTVAAELLQSSSRKEFYKPFPYLTDRMSEAFAAADVVVARAGATTLAEITRLQKPSLLIPLASAANDHQRRNAQVYEERGAARVLDPNNLGRNLFLRSLKDLCQDQAARAEIARNLAPLDHPQAARDIVSLIFKLASGLIPAAAKTKE
ncbi:MAG: UDP-N-acetylglucosamine--N-acetylmuramyl-(pentapeptide) pyrophosphoryl-undecaprenol N-acetylglucosamine transferase [Candidatus Andersenbacteria bacterium]